MLLDRSAINEKVEEVNKISSEVQSAQKEYEDMGKLLKELKVYKVDLEKELKDLITGKKPEKGDYNEAGR